MANIRFEERNSLFNEIVQGDKALANIIPLLTQEFVGHQFFLQYFPNNTPIDEERIEIGGTIEGWIMDCSSKTLTLVSGALCLEGFFKPLTFNLVSKLWTMQCSSAAAASNFTRSLHLRLY